MQQSGEAGEPAAPDKTETHAVLGIVGIFLLRMVGMWLLMPTLALHAEALPGATPLLVGACVGAAGLTQGIFQVPFGAWSDRYGRRRVIAFGLVMFAIGSFVSAQATTAWALLFGRVLQGTGAINSSLVALVTDLTGPHARARAMAALGGAVGVALAVGMIAGPALAARFGVPALFYTASVLSVVAAVYVVVGIPRPRSHEHHADVEWTGGQLGPLLRSMFMVRLTFGIFVLHVTIAALLVVGPRLLLEHIPTSKHGNVYATIFPLALVVMFLAARNADRKGKLRETVMAGSVVLLGSGTMLALGHGNLYLVAGAIACAVFGVALAEPTMPAMLSRLTPPHARGTASGLFFMFEFLGAFAGSMLGGHFLSRPEPLGYLLLAGASAWVLLTLGLPRLSAAPS